MSDSLKDFLIRLYSGLILSIWIVMPYALLQRFSIYDIIWVQPSAFDNAIPLNYHSLWFYLSLPLLIFGVGFFAERQVYLRYLYAIGWTTMAAHMVFFLLPNGLARDGIDVSSAPAAYQWVVSVDAPRNAFPSLHVALSILAGIMASSSKNYSKLARGFIWFWVLGICWSTIAVRQHIIVDVIGGTVIAAACWWLVQRCCKKELV